MNLYGMRLCLYSFVSVFSHSLFRSLNLIIKKRYAKHSYSSSHRPRLYSWAGAWDNWNSYFYSCTEIKSKLNPFQECIWHTNTIYTIAWGDCTECNSFWKFRYWKDDSIEPNDLPLNHTLPVVFRHDHHSPICRQLRFWSGRRCLDSA